MNEMYAHMATLNKKAAEILKKYNIQAATDVTGFGLIGHALEMVKGTALSLTLYSNEIPVYDGAEDLAAMGIIPGGAYNNRKYAEGLVHLEEGIPLSLEDVLYDPVTSGGLLVAIKKEDEEKVVADFKRSGVFGKVIGKVTKEESHKIFVKSN